MPELLGINHLTLSTTDLDRLVGYGAEFLGATLAFARGDRFGPRIAAPDTGGDGVVTPPTRWTTAARDADGRPVDVRAWRGGRVPHGGRVRGFRPLPVSTPARAAAQGAPRTTGQGARSAEQ
ncbi:hypothetical protein [Streptomyces candidus]|uniref:Uncharacterized protein n=1 Tax=Streptomyces candidus TaxID=67283 RepID=A0A7X0HE14_9ACTN|nr:hypothetical protein [Streptomyces candidus]MBB6435806.1 hypothetical protein [Streptomyces candidus]